MRTAVRTLYRQVLIGSLSDWGFARRGGTGEPSTCSGTPWTRSPGPLAADGLDSDGMPIGRLEARHFGCWYVGEAD